MGLGERNGLPSAFPLSGVLKEFKAGSSIHFFNPLKLLRINSNRFREGLPSAFPLSGVLEQNIAALRAAFLF